MKEQAISWATSVTHLSSPDADVLSFRVWVWGGYRTGIVAKKRSSAEKMFRLQALDQ